MRRSLDVFRVEGFDPVPSIALLATEHLKPPPLLLPDSDSRDLSHEAIYDWAASVYYWGRGWSAGRRRNENHATAERPKAVERPNSSWNNSARVSVLDNSDVSGPASVFVSVRPSSRARESWSARRDVSAAFAVGRWALTQNA